PSVDKQALNATINAQSLLQTPQQFRDITLRVNQDGSEVKLGEVRTPVREGMRRVMSDKRFVTYVLTLAGYYMLAVQVMLMLPIM
ncbi:hypothetical protein MJH54_32045, partial [Salmonella enterica subsp. enterica serovar Montevideo]|nr:hypothetical protein [Salmonella enterica subsp. enterica serovar Montevideo]